MRPLSSARLPLLTLLSAALLAACGGAEDDAARTPQAAAPQAQTLAATDAADASLQADEAAIEAAIEAAAAAGDDGLVPASDPRRRALATTVPQLTVRASGSMAGGTGPVMQVRVNGTVIGSVEVRDTQSTSYTFAAPTLRRGAKVEVVFTNDAWINGQDRNLYVDYLTDGTTSVLPTLPGAVVDKGAGDKAFDGADTVPGQRDLYWGAALRLTWPSTSTTSASVQARRNAAARMLLQATFGPNKTEIDRLAATTPAKWIDKQIALRHKPDFVTHVQAQYDRGAEYRPGGSRYSATGVTERFWATAATSSDQLRKRVGFALHHILMASMADSNLYEHSRAYANYLDTLNKHAFGNYRDLLEDISLSPVMGIYLSHIRNRKEDPATGRLPDENFAREVMQLFSIGLVELNPDGTPRTDSGGQPIETYNNADVMALAKIFTGWSWGFPDNQLTDSRFRWGWPDYKQADQRVDLERMKSYPGQFSTAAVQLFAGKAHAVSIPEGGTAQARLKLALDGLFKHPNVGPFISRQLIQQLVTSQPSAAYVARVAAVFANNGRGVRGDMAAVVKAVLLDDEARGAPPPNFGKLREPVLRVTHWMRAFIATSASGDYMMAWELDNLSQRATAAPSVFGWFRPGYVPPGTSFATRNATAPEFQIVNESTTAAWVNRVEGRVGWGIGWTGSKVDVTTSFKNQVSLISKGNLEGLVQDLNLLLFAGTMSPELRQDLLDAVGGVSGSDADSHLNRARIAAYVAMSSPEFLAQR